MLLEDEGINTVTNGLLDEIAMNKHTSYGLGHFMINSFTMNKTFNVSVTLYLMDIVYDNKETDEDNLDDVLNTTLAIATRFLDRMRRGDVRLEQFALTGSPSLVPFKERFEDDVAGWEITFDIEVPKNMTIC
jgi:hypothetical protein